MVFVEVCIRDATILPKADIIFLIAFFSLFTLQTNFLLFILLCNFIYLSFLFVLQRAAMIVRLCAQISQIAFVLLISTGPGKIVDGRVVSVQVNILHQSFCQFSQFMLALRIIHMVGYRSSRLNQNKPFSGPVSTLLSSSAEF